MQQDYIIKNRVPVQYPLLRSGAKFQERGFKKLTTGCQTVHPKKAKKFLKSKKNPRKRMYMKPKAGNSFSISKRRRYSFETEKKWKKWRAEPTRETDASSSTSTQSSTSVEGVDENESMELATDLSIDDDEWETETSVEKMRSAELTSVDESVIPPPESFRDNVASLVFLSESYGPVANSTPRFFSGGKSLPFSVNKFNLDSLKEAIPHVSTTMRSDGITQRGELLTIPNVSFENEFAKERDTLQAEDFPLKPISPEQNLALPEIPNDVFQESQEQNEDNDIEMKSISPEQSVPLPDVPENVSYENQEQREEILESNERKDLILSPFKRRDEAERRDSIACPDGSNISQNSDVSTEPNFEEDPILSPFKKRDNAKLTDSIACSEVLSPGGSNTSEHSDVSTVPNFEEEDQEYCNNNPSKTSVENKSTNSNSGKRKQEGEVGNSFEDIDDYNNAEDFRETRNFQTDSFKEKGKGYRVNNSINDNITRWKRKNEGVNFLEYKSDCEENFENVQKIQTKELRDDELLHFQPQTVASRIESGVDNKRQKDNNISFLNRSQKSVSQRKKFKNEGESLFEVMDKNNSENSSETAQNVQNEEFQDDELVNNQQEAATHQKKTNRIKFASILSRSKNSNQKEKSVNKTGHFFEDIDNYNRVDNFRKDETPKRKGSFYRKGKLSFSQRIKTPHIRKHRKKGGNLFKDIDKKDSEDSLDTVQNEENEELQNVELDNNQPEISTYQSNRKNNKYVGTDNTTQKDANITIRSQSSLTLKKKHKDGENFLEDMDKNDHEESFDTVQNEQNEEWQDLELDNNQLEISTYQSNRKINKYVGADNITQKDANIKNRSQSSLSRKRKHKNGKNLPEDMNKNDSEGGYDNEGGFDREDRFDTIQNEQNEELQDYELDHNIPSISAQEKKRKNNIHVGADNMMQQNAIISNRSQSSARQRQHNNERENSFEDLNKIDNVKSSENIQKNQNDRDKAGNSSEDTFNRGDNFEDHNISINTSKRKSFRRRFGIKRNSRVNRSRKTANTLSRSKNSTSREVSVGLQNRKNEAAKSNWPRCCIEASSYLNQTFQVLKPIFNDDYPIDSITLLNYGLLGSEKKCKH